MYGALSVNIADSEVPGVSEPNDRPVSAMEAKPSSAGGRPVSRPQGHVVACFPQLLPGAQWRARVAVHAHGVRPELRALAHEQSGLITRRQALLSGCTERELRTLTAVGGPWVVVRRGVYCPREVWEAAGRAYNGQARLRDIAVHLVMVTDHLMSHDSAARAHGIPMLRPGVELSHVTRLGVGGARTEHGVRHHLSRICLLNTPQVDGMTVTGLARTGLDLAREHGLRMGVVALDHVLGLGVTAEDLDAELLAMWCWPNVTRARAARELCRVGADSAGESLTRLAVRELGLGEPETQFPVSTPRGVAWTDLLLGCHVIEFDGRQKFRRVEEGGLATRDIGEIMWDERERQNLVCQQGLGMSRVHWAELFPPLYDAMLARVRREYDVTRQRFGTVLPGHLREFAERMAAERERRIRHQRMRPPA